MQALTVANALAATYVLTALAPASSRQDEVLVRWHDARALLAPELTREPSIDLRTHLRAARLNDLEPDRYDIELEEPLSLVREGLGDILEELVLGVPGVEDLDIDERSGVLRVAGSALAQAEFARLLVDLSTLATDSVEVELRRLTSVAWGAQRGAVLDAAGAEALFAGGQTSLIARRTIPVGRSSALSTSAFESFLYDYDVEVAQAAVAADPQVTVMRTGIDFAAHVRVAADGRLALRVWGRDGASEQPHRERVIPGFGGAALQLPRVVTQLFVGSAVIPAGGALLVGDANGASGFVVRVQRPNGASAPGGATSPFVACGEVALRAARTWPRAPHHASPSGGWQPRDDDKPAWFEDMDPLLEPEEVFDTFQDLCQERGLEGRMRRIGAYIYVPDEGALRTATREHVAGLNGALAAETFEVELRYGELPSTELAGLVTKSTQEGSFEPLLARLAQRVLTAARSGDSASVTQGVESFYLQDYDVEIAQAASIPDPIVAPLFEGLTFWCLPLRAATGEVVTTVDLVRHAAATTLREFGIADWDHKATTEVDKNPLPIGEFVLRNKVELADSRPVVVRNTTRTEDGAWALVVVAPIDSERSFAALLRVTGHR
jgi:hypothetical protein